MSIIFERSYKKNTPWSYIHDDLIQGTLNKLPKEGASILCKGAYGDWCGSNFFSIRDGAIKLHDTCGHIAAGPITYRILVSDGAVPDRRVLLLLGKAGV